MMDAEASSAADTYIGQLSAYYKNKEITDGIEERMAELLLERVPKGGVVGKSDIDSIIDILCRPERIEADEPKAQVQEEKVRKRLFRDMEHAKVGGVCSGLAAYFKTETAILRIGFTVLSLAGFCFFAETVSETCEIIIASNIIRHPAISLGSRFS